MKMLKGMQFIIFYVVCILSLTVNCFHLRSSYSNKHYTNGRDNIPFVINNNYNNVQRIIQSSYNPYHITSLHCQTTSYNDESINGNVKSNDNDNANRSNQLRDILKGSCIFFVGKLNIIVNYLSYYSYEILMFVYSFHILLYHAILEYITNVIYFYYLLFLLQLLLLLLLLLLLQQHQ